MTREPIVAHLLTDNERLRDEVERLQAESDISDGLLADAKAEIAQLRAALTSIAKNTCCDRCQEAALVARAALENKL